MLMLVGAGPNTHGFGKYPPIFIAANSVSAVKAQTCPGSVLPCPHFLSAWAGFGMTLLYAAVVLAAGGWLLARRDA